MRSELSERDASLTLFSDRSFSTRICRLSGNNWRPIIVHSDRVYYHFRSTPSSGSGGGATKWGYRFYISRLTGLQWLSEPQVRDSCFYTDV